MHGGEDGYLKYFRKMKEFRKSFEGFLKEFRGSFEKKIKKNFEILNFE